MLPDEDAARADIHAKHAAALSLMAEALTLAVTVIVQAEWKTGPDRNASAVHILAGLFTKLCKTYRAIMLCLHNGLGQDAQALGRMLFENAIMILWILEEDATDRAYRVAAFSLLQQEKMINAWTANPDLQDHANEALRQRVADTLAPFRTRLGDEEIGNLKRTFAGVSIETLAHRVGGRVAYDTLYRCGSDNIHCSDVSQHVTVADDGSMTINLSPGDIWLQPVMHAATALLLSALGRLDAVLALGRANAIDALADEIRAFTPVDAEHE